MNTFRLQWLSAVLLVLGGHAQLAAAGSATAALTVSASVNLTCAITTSPVTFGRYDPLSGAENDATGAVVITCTQGAVCDIALDAGGHPRQPGNIATRRMKPAQLDGSLPYALFVDDARTTLWGNQFASNPRFVTHTGNGQPQKYPVYGRIAAGQFVPAGLYTDTVIATLTYH